MVAGLLAQWIPTLLFMVSGAAAFIALRNRSNGRFLRERWTRLMVPFVVGSVLLTPIQLFWEQRHRGASAESGLGFTAELWRDLTSEPDIIGPRFFVETGLHLWFLAFLFVISVICLPALRWIRGGGARLVDALAHVATRRLGLLVFVVPLAASRFLLPARGPGRYDWADFTFLGLYFLAGALLFADARFLEALRRDRWALLALGVAADLFMVGLFATGQLPDGFTEYGTAAFFIGWVAVSVLTWCWTLVALDAGRAMLDFSTERLRRWTGGVTAFYLLHQPVLVGVAFVVVAWEVPALVQFGALLLVSLAVTLLLVEGARRVSPISFALGMKSGA